MPFIILPGELSPFIWSTIDSIAIGASWPIVWDPACRKFIELSISANLAFIALKFSSASCGGLVDNQVDWTVGETSLNNKTLSLNVQQVDCLDESDWTAASSAWICCCKLSSTVGPTDRDWESFII